MIASPHAGTDAVRRACPAKINLSLRVLGRRPDGFHELDSLVARVSLFDQLTLAPRADQRVTLACDQPGIPTDERNLVLRALHTLAPPARAPRGGVDILLHKRIPPGAGLGGGSSNAAAMLSALCELWRLDGSRQALASLAAEIGSDVTLFLHGPVVRMRGRGERVEDLPFSIAGAVLLVLPPIHCDTAAVYRARAALGPAQPDPAPAAPAWPAGAVAATRLRPWLVNDLMGAAFVVAPELRHLHQQVESLCGAPVAMSGSGSALFLLVDTMEEARSWADRVRERTGCRVEACTF